MPCLCEPKSTSDQHMCVLPSKIAFIKLKLNTLNVLAVLPRPTYSATARMERCTIRFTYAFLVLCMKLYAMGVCKSPYDVHLARCARRDKVWCHRLENDSSSKIVNFVWVIIGAGTDEKEKTGRERISILVSGSQVLKTRWQLPSSASTACI